METMQGSIERGGVRGVVKELAGGAVKSDVVGNVGAWRAVLLKQGCGMAEHSRGLAGCEISQVMKGYVWYAETALALISERDLDLHRGGALCT